MLKGIVIVGRFLRNVLLSIFMCITYVQIFLLAIVFSILRYEQFTSVINWNETWVSAMKDLWDKEKLCAPT